MTLNGFTGCNSFSGQASLHDNKIKIISIQSEDKMCRNKQVLQLEQNIIQVLNHDEIITIDNEKNLFLQVNDEILEYYLNDWR